MDRSFRRGMFIGVLGPLAFLTGVVYWIYRYTHKVSFPVDRPAEGELTLKLIYPEEVPIHWQRWKAELEPAIAKCQELATEIRVTCQSLFKKSA
jgi:hypothetical protein